MKDANYGDDLVLLRNIPAQAESQLHNLELATSVVGLYMIADKNENVFKTRGNYLLFKSQASEIYRLVHIFRQQYLIY